MATTALPSPVKAQSATGSTSTPSKAALAQQKMEAAFSRMKAAAAKVGERREAITEGLIVTAEIQGATFAASFLSGWMHRRGKSLKVMGVDTRPVAAGAMIMGGLWADSNHALALGNGVMASWTAEMAFDLGVKYATPKAEAAAAPSAAPAPAPAQIPTGDVPQVFYNGNIGDETGDEVGRRGGGGGRGGGGRQIRVQRRPTAAEKEEGEEATRAREATETGDEVGGLFPQDRINAHYKTWKVKRAKAQAHGNPAKAARLQAEADTQMTRAQKVYQAVKNKNKIALPAAFAWFKTGRRPAAAAPARPSAAPAGGGGEEEMEWDDEGADLDAAVNEMSDEDMAAMAGVIEGEDGDIGGDDEIGGDEMGDEMGFDD